MEGGTEPDVGVALEAEEHADASTSNAPLIATSRARIILPTR